MNSSPISRPDQMDSPSSQQLPQTGLPMAGRLAGIDYGTARIGIAACDYTQQFVNPMLTYNRRNERLDALYFSNLCKQEQIVGWVIGLPIHCDGNESQKSVEVRQFANWLSNLTSLPHLYYDERFSSREARTLMHDTGWSPKQKKKNVDRLAAYIILSHFLDFRKHNPDGQTNSPTQPSGLDT